LQAVSLIKPDTLFKMSAFFSKWQVPLNYLNLAGKYFHFLWKSITDVFWTNVLRYKSNLSLNNYHKFDWSAQITNVQEAENNAINHSFFKNDFTVRVFVYWQKTVYICRQNVEKTHWICLLLLLLLPRMSLVLIICWSMTSWQIASNSVTSQYNVLPQTALIFFWIFDFTSLATCSSSNIYSPQNNLQMNNTIFFVLFLTIWLNFIAEISRYSFLNCSTKLNFSNKILDKLWEQVNSLL